MKMKDWISRELSTFCQHSNPVNNMNVPSIDIYYGPYIYEGFLRHRTQRFHGIIQSLTKLGYEIEIVPWMHRNRLSVMISGRTIYSCSLEYLPFNMECNDVVCKNVVEAVKGAVNQIFSDKNVVSYTSASKGLRALQEMKSATVTVDNFEKDIGLWFETPRPIDPVQEFEEYSFPYTHLTSK